MNTTLRQVRFVSLLCTAALLAGAGRTLAATDSYATTNAVAAPALRVTTKDDYKDFSFGKLRGTGVHAADGKQLGTIRDLVLDAHTAEPKFVVVSGGGFVGIGGHDRVLPYEALIRDPNGKDFLTRLQRVDWELLPEIEKADIDEGRLVLTTQQRHHVGELRDQRWAQAFETLSTSDTDAGTRRYQFASAAIGKALYGEDEKVGKVEDLYIDPRGGPVQAVVAIDADYVGADHEYLVPLSSLQVPAGKGERVHTTLAADDFRAAAGVHVDRPADARRDDRRWVRVKDRNDDRPRARESVVTETRETHVDVAPAAVSTRMPDRDRAIDERASATALDDAARAIREHWNADPDLNRRGLRVTPDGGRLILEGKVPTVRLAQQAESSAHRVTSGIPIENHIRVDDSAP